MKAKPKRRWYQFSLGTLFLLETAACLFTNTVNSEGSYENHLCRCDRWINGILSVSNDGHPSGVYYGYAYDALRTACTALLRIEWTASCDAVRDTSSAKPFLLG